MYHKVHLGDNAVVWMELTEVMVVVADQNRNIDRLIFCDLGAEQVVHYFHQNQKIPPVFIIIRNMIRY